MPTLVQVRDELTNTIVNAVPSLIGYSTVPDVAQVPAIVVHPDSCNYQIGMGNCQEWDFSIYVLVSRTETQVKQDELDSYLSTSGSNSVPAALRAAGATLGLSGVDATLMRMSGYGGSWDSARVPHVGARLHVRVIITE